MESLVDYVSHEIPVINIPSEGWAVFPEPILGECTDATCHGAPDMRGMCKVSEVCVAGLRDPDHKMLGSVQRIEQATGRIGRFLKLSTQA